MRRCDAQPLKDDLPPKKEFLIECILTDLQLKMYKSLVGIAVKGSTLSHFQQVLRLLNHPSIYVHSSAVVEKKSVAAEKSPAAAENLRQNEDEMQVDLPSLKVNGTDGVEAAPEILSAPPYTTTSSSPIYVPPCSEGGNTYTEEQRIVLENCKDIIDLSNIIYSNKMVLILSIVESCIELDEKVLIFSRSIPTIRKSCNCLRIIFCCKPKSYRLLLNSPSQF